MVLTTSGIDVFGIIICTILLQYEFMIIHPNSNLDVSILESLRYFSSSKVPIQYLSVYRENRSRSEATSLKVTDSFYHRRTEINRGTFENRAAYLPL